MVMGGGVDRALPGIGWPLACRQLPTGLPGYARVRVPDLWPPMWRQGLLWVSGWGALHWALDTQWAPVGPAFWKLAFRRWDGAGQVLSGLFLAFGHSCLCPPTAVKQPRAVSLHVWVISRRAHQIWRPVGFLPAPEPGRPVYARLLGPPALLMLYQRRGLRISSWRG